MGIHNDLDNIFGEYPKAAIALFAAGVFFGALAATWIIT